MVLSRDWLPRPPMFTFVPRPVGAQRRLRVTFPNAFPCSRSAFGAGGAALAPFWPFIPGYENRPKSYFGGLPLHGHRGTAPRDLGMRASRGLEAFH